MLSQHFLHTNVVRAFTLCTDGAVAAVKAVDAVKTVTPDGVLHVSQRVLLQQSF